MMARDAETMEEIIEAIGSIGIALLGRVAEYV